MLMKICGFCYLSISSDPVMRRQQQCCSCAFVKGTTKVDPKGFREIPEETKKEN